MGLGRIVIVLGQLLRSYPIIIVIVLKAQLV